jgi:hypothetical protein
MSTNSSERVTLSIEEARELGHQAIGRLGYANEEAAIIVDHLMDAELCGCGYNDLCLRESRLTWKATRRAMQRRPAWVGCSLSAATRASACRCAYRCSVCSPARLPRPSSTMDSCCWRSTRPCWSRSPISSAQPELVEKVKSTPRRGDAGQLRLPSERAFNERRDRLAAGTITLDRVVYEALNAYSRAGGSNP